MTAKRVVVLGATGSIGSQTLDCIRQANLLEPGSFIVAGLAAQRSMEKLIGLGKEFPGASLALLEKTPEASRAAPGIRFTGPDAVRMLLDSVEADLAVNGISGSAGLTASLHALSSGKNLALANKESVVMAWGLLRAEAEKRSLAIVPVDSEHAALFQLFNRLGRGSITEIAITASGGPFRTRPIGELSSVQPDEAARHPVWPMGRKISIDSATLANKGLEIIEAVRLFSLPQDKVKVLIHPESLVHALARTMDGALYAHMSSPDMRLPIGIALQWPREVGSAFGFLDLAGKTLHFESPDPLRYPVLALAREALRQDEAGPIAYNAADEVAVEAFEKGLIGFMDIHRVVGGTLESGWRFPAGDLSAIFEADARAREMAREIVLELKC